MKKFLSILFKDPLDSVGSALIVISATCLSLSGQFGRRNEITAFFANYSLSVGYLLILMFTTYSRYRWHFSAGKIRHTIFLLVLWFISAFALNRDMIIFDSSVDWLTIWIILSVIVVLLATRFASLPPAFNVATYFLLGSALLLFSYYAIYLVPLYAISILGILAIGISLHTYIPLFLSIVTVILINRGGKQDKRLRYVAAAGFLVPVVVCAFFLIKWNTTNNTINGIINQHALNESKLPVWVTVSQQIDKSFLSERILKAGLVYHEATGDNIFWAGMPSRSFNEPQKHDPLVVIATLLFSKPNLDEKERIQILKSMYNARHQAQERLWSGDHLETISVISNVKLFPEYRMAYTEKTLSIRNTSNSQWTNQEAIYTFHLSQGSVISSLSLWINGKEEMSRLTTKGKADSAYHTVVGIEVRDPSVVHWQEGNTISVRIFPCPVDENRKFKIGITSPLSKQGDNLVYENATFDGPSAIAALETMQVSSTGNPIKLQLPQAFEEINAGVYQANRTYQPDWKISCKAPALASSVFTFNGTTYQAIDYKEQNEFFSPDYIYLDINNSWSEAELMQLWPAIRNKRVYAIAGQPIKLTELNLSKVFHQMNKHNFSLLPINKIKERGKSLVISKSSNSSPNLNELEGSEFAEELTEYCKSASHIRFYNIGYQLTPYLKALKEFRILNYNQGNISRLQQLLQKNEFPKDQEDENTVVIANAGLTIRKVTGKQVQSAPDHLLRLFAYNDIMKKVGAGYFKEDYVKSDIIAEAAQAYIVSPVSSLIVLETQNDYNRFGIEENKNSLKNASLKSSGAVPEPHEWMLILLGATVIFYTLSGKKPVRQKI